MKKILILLCFSILVLSGCRNEGEDINPNSENELNIYGWSPTAGEEYAEYFENWATEQLGYTVNVTTASQNSNMQLTASLSAGNNFDLIYIDQSEYQSLVEQGALISINDIVNENSELQFLKELEYMESLVVDGNVYAFPLYNPGFYAPVVRVDWLEEFGMEMPDSLDEWELYFKNCKEIKGAYGLSLNSLGAIQPFMSYFDLKEGVVYSEDGSYTVPYASEEASEAIAWFVDMFEKGYINPNYETQSQADVNEQFTEGNTGCIIQNSNTIGLINEYAKDPKFDAQITPPSKYYSYGDMQMLAIPATANNVELVGDFMSLWYSEEGNFALKNGYEGFTYYYDSNNELVYTEMYPGYKEVMGSKIQVNPEYNDTNDELVIEAYQIGLNAATNVEKVLEWPQINSIIQKYYTKAIKQELTPEQAISQMQAEILNIYSETLNVYF